MASQSKLYRTIKPKKMNRKVFRQEMQKGLDETGKYMLKQFGKTVRTWNEKPEFKVRTNISRQPLSVTVWTTSKVYGYVDKGTKTHIVKPKKKGGVLVFPQKSTPKTTPRLISSKKGYKSKKMVFVRGPVKVKGIKARKFTIEITKRTRPKFKDMMQKSLNRAARRCGHSLRKI